MTSPPTLANSSIPFLPTPLPYMTSSVASVNTTNPTLNATTLNATTFGTMSETPESPHSLPLRSLHDLLSNDLESTEWGPISAEFLNYALALLVYAVRYPAVFWNTNKGFGTLFSFQLLANGVQSLLSYAGICVLYKVQVVGLNGALPNRVLKSSLDESPLLLDAHITLALFVLSNGLVLASSLVLYLYGYGRFNAFLNAERSRRVIVLRDGRAGGNWGYFTHCAALCVLLSMAVCNAPLLYDCTVLYRRTLDGAILLSVVGAISHLFLWVLLWLVLTVKRRWVFKLRVTVGRAAVRSARSVKLVTEVDLISSRHCADETSAPLLVVGNGRTYTVQDTSPKKAIMSVIQKAALDRKARAAGQGDKSIDEGEEQIYWLRPKPPSPTKTSPDSSSDRLAWLNRKLSPSPSGMKHKVTFDESAKKGKSPKSGKGRAKGQPRGQDRPMSESEDDGDYATLREIPLMSTISEPSEDSVSEDNKLLDCALRDDSVTYARTNRDLTPGDYEDPSPLLTPEHPDSPRHPPVTVTVHTISEEDPVLQAPVTPQCLRRADSGMPNDELPPRSGSVSTESSGGSPPCSGNHSETSSGVSSARDPEPRRATSVDDLALESDNRVAPPWRSFSLQRNVMPPTAQTIYGFHSATTVQVPGRPAILLESNDESTVVIRRKQLRPKTTEGVVIPPPIKEEPFGRSTNMRMTSFTDNPDGSRPGECFPSSSSTLPHYPTQPAAVGVSYPHCSTMPLPNSVPPPIAPPSTGSCHSFPRHHTTIPTHHNGVRLFGGPNPFVKRFPPFHHQVVNGRPHQTVMAPTYVNAEIAHNGGHHSFSHLMAQVKYNATNHRDSANFSMASSGDSDQYLPHAGQT